MASDTMLAQSEAQAERTAAKSPRYWPAVVLLAMYWTFAFACRHLELSTGDLFISRVIALLVFLLAFSIWWLTNRRIPRSERWLTVAVTLTGAALVSPFTWSTLGPAALILGLIFVFTLGTLWLLVSKRASPRVRRWGLWLTICLVWIGCTLVRWNGLSGDQESDIHWRWEPTAEELFLAEHKRSAGDGIEESATPIELTPGDWPEFRGLRRDGCIAASGLNWNWKTSPPQQVWKKRVGPSWSSVIVVGGRLYTQEQRGEKEAVVCYEAATGSELWVHEDAGRFTESVSGAGPRATPTFANGRIYAAGARGQLNCLDAAAGRALWSRDLVAETGAEVPQWAFSTSPLVVDGLVVAFAGGPEDNGLLAYRADTGEPVWKVATGKLSYSSPQLASLDGMTQILFLSDRGLVAVEPASGVVLWERKLVEGKMQMPAIQPHVVGETAVVVQHGEKLCLLDVRHQDDAWHVAPRWVSRFLRPSFNDVVIHNGSIYGFDEGIFVCVDVKTGKRRWKEGRYGHGQVLLLTEQALLLVMTEKGEAILLAANPQQHEERGRFQALAGKTWNHAVLAHGRFYVRNDEEMACYKFDPK